MKDVNDAVAAFSRMQLRGNARLPVKVVLEGVPHDITSIKVSIIDGDSVAVIEVDNKEN